MDDAIKQILRFLFTPPELPQVAVPFFVKVLPAGRLAIKQALELMYHQGVMVGILTGILITLSVQAILKRARGR